MSAMATYGQSCIQQVIIVGMVTILALSVGSSCSPSRSLLEETRHHGGKFQLLHWSHSESPFHVPGLSLAQKTKHAVRKSKERAAVLSSRIQESGAASAGNSTNTTLVSPLSSRQGEYAMEITIGTPPVKFAALADTGSDLVWVQCSPCSNCPKQTDPLFDPTKSSTYRTVNCTDPLCAGEEFRCDSIHSTCQYELEYGGGAVEQGDLSYDTIVVTSSTGNTITSSDFAFGCGHDDTGDVLNLDGLVGLGRGSISFASQLVGIYGDKFSYCLNSFYDSADRTSPLLFGNAAVPNVSTQYTPMLRNPLPELNSFYYIGLTGINVNGVSLNIGNSTFEINPNNGLGGTMSDSGTTLTLLVEPAYSPLLTTLNSLITYPKIANSSESLELDLCYNLSSVPSPKFPQVTMVFDGFSLDLPQENTFLVVDEYNSTCLAFGQMSAISGFNIFGNIQQQNFQILYDREAEQFGFAKVQCDTLTA